ncbi:hypothetical protein PoB_000784100 [Plakobranchus ocellatus]|uniref:Uncharacterized protein n=1 Tax=Plakobranchus ocellatus TaxID=259542 RepID=A0AAV3Y2A1_9GAST|nr:hypothetical protein PoB_000784100 [Plakobranchus ocellatus]
MPEEGTLAGPMGAEGVYDKASLYATWGGEFGEWLDGESRILEGTDGCCNFLLACSAVAASWIEGGGAVGRASLGCIVDSRGHENTFRP